MPSLHGHPWTTFSPLKYRAIVDNMARPCALKTPKPQQPKPIPMYPCGNCGTIIPRIQAIHQAGYCQKCELMTQSEVMAYLMIAPSALYRYERRGHWHPIRIGVKHVLYHRAEIEQTKAHRDQKKMGWARWVSDAA